MKEPIKSCEISVIRVAAIIIAIEVLLYIVVVGLMEMFGG